MKNTLNPIWECGNQAQYCHPSHSQKGKTTVLPGTRKYLLLVCLLLSCSVLFIRPMQVTAEHGKEADKKQRIGLALGAGGAKGISHIAFLKVLDELKIKPDVMSGTSIGAVIGALYAAGISGRELEKLAGTIKFKDVYKLLDMSLLSGDGLFKGTGVIAFLEQHLPVKTFEELKIPLKIVATDFWSHEEVIFQSGEIIPAVRASCSLPAIFKPMVWQSRILIDGGTVNPLPYDLLRSECDLLIAIDVSGQKTPPPEDNIPGMFEAIMSTFQIMQASVVATKLTHSKPDIYVKPSLENIRVLEFHKFREILRGVRKNAEQFRQVLKRKNQLLGENMIVIQ